MSYAFDLSFSALHFRKMFAYMWHFGLWKLGCNQSQRCSSQECCNQHVCYWIAAATGHSSALGASCRSRPLAGKRREIPREGAHSVRRQHWQVHVGCRISAHAIPQAVVMGRAIHGYVDVVGIMPEMAMEDSPFSTFGAWQRHEQPPLRWYGARCQPGATCC